MGSPEEHLGDDHRMELEADVLDGGISTSGEFPNTGDSQGAYTHSPYSGEFKGGTWNTQALFAAKVHVFHEKNRKAKAIMGNNDFTCFQETHALEGRTVAFTIPDCMCAVANGTARKGGIGIVLKREFLLKFNTVVPERDFEVIEGEEWPPCIYLACSGTST